MGLLRFMRRILPSMAHLQQTKLAILVETVAMGKDRITRIVAVGDHPELKALGHSLDRAGAVAGDLMPNHLIVIILLLNVDI